MAEQGDDLSRKAKLARAKAHLQKGVEEAAGAGLKPAEVAALVKEIVRKGRAGSNE